MIRHVLDLLILYYNSRLVFIAENSARHFNMLAKVNSRCPEATRGRARVCNAEGPLYGYKGWGTAGQYKS